MCQLTGQEVANASMYDGSTAATEAVLMAETVDVAAPRAGGALRASRISRGAEDLRQKFRARPWKKFPSQADGTVDAKALQSSLKDDVAAVLVQSPNFLGRHRTNRGTGATSLTKPARYLSSAITEAVSLGVVKPPAEADIVAMEGQSFGLAPSYGGPYVGVIASREKSLYGKCPAVWWDKPPIRMAAADFVLTLATREQHIRREKATSNICTNQALCALAATVHLCLLGKEGLREMAHQNLSKARFALAELEKIPGVRRAFDAPFFNEFTVELPRSVKLVNAQLLRDKIIGPFVLGRDYPELTKHALVCVTETITRAEIERFASALRSALEQPV